MSAVWYRDEEQHAAVKASKAAQQQKMSTRITTEIAPLGKFYLAEEYHQKYLDRSRR
eukprot:m.43812 g.43812  ORF g.43812 m.43812 type:complete len:57 (+) comp10796_c0_seq3:695-865(+)